MIDEVVVGNKYKSRSGVEFKVNHIARHGQDCSEPMIVYVNLKNTSDAKAGQVWVISESIFIKRFNII